MSHTDYTRNILNIKDRNIYFSENCLEVKKIKGIMTKVFYGVLTYIPTHCDKCGCLNEGHDDIIKWGFKRNCNVKLPKLSGYNTILKLTKQRYYCKHCNDTFIATTSLIDKYKSISRNSELQIKLDLMDKISEKDISKRNNVSHNKVNRIMDEISIKTVLPGTLPTIMNFDEFKATKDTLGKMTFLITNNETGQVFDILESRKYNYLDKYFRIYGKNQRDKVKFIITDMYKPYLKLSKALFKNAEIVIDRFHIVGQAYTALNITRVKLCIKSNPNYNKLKHYWKLILKNENDLNDKKKTYSKHFKKYLNEQEIVTYLINTNPTLKATYNTYQGIINSIRDKDINKFLNIIHKKQDNLSPHMIKSLRTYRDFEKYIINSFKYNYNNGVIEGTNNLIKCIKRIAFGYRSFNHFKTRILLIKGIIKIKNVIA